MTLIYLLLIASGVFLLVYGGLLFRFTLAAGGFVLGFALVSWLLASQPATTRVLIGLVVGGIVGALAYFLVKLALHFAGGLLGAVLALVIVSLLPFTMPAVLGVLLILGGAGVVGFFGRQLGDWIIILATALTGAYAVVYGLTRIFPASMEVVGEYTSALVPFTGPAFLVFLLFFATGVLSQYQLRRVRGRYVNRTV